MSKTRKFYVVWEGRVPGIYDSWDDCREQIEGYPGARYRSFTSQQAATEAFRGDPEQHMAFLRRLGDRSRAAGGPVDYTTRSDIRLDAWAVDGACSGNPGRMEYRGVRVADGAELFRVGPYDGGTNNIGEYLALVHALALLDRAGDTTTPVYSDSVTGQAWVRRRAANTRITPTEANAPPRAVIERADRWLQTHRPPNPIIKWDTERWGEIPADFGRK